MSSNSFCLNKLQVNLIISATASFLFFGGWWLMADKDIYDVTENNRLYHIPGIVATLAFLSINIVPAHFFYDSITYNQGCFSPGVAKLYLFIWLMISFGCLIGAFYILINDFILDQKRYQWPGYGICLQNILIFASSMLLRFGKQHEHFY